MYFLNGDHIRVVTPITVNGVIPKLDEHGMQAYKETFLPLTAKKFIEEQNLNLPNHLKKIIEIISDKDEQPAPHQADQTETVVSKPEEAKRFHRLGRPHLNTVVKTQQ
jgi:hypothetical protein